MKVKKDSHIVFSNDNVGFIHKLGRVLKAMISYYLKIENVFFNP